MTTDQSQALEQISRTPLLWSAISHRLSLELGMVSPASQDWSLEQTTWPMAIMIASGGISAALLAKWTVRVGVRRAMLTGSVMFGSGMLLASVGVLAHNLPLLYLGNIVCGVGYGCAYTPPLQALIDWFPDKKGLASGRAHSFLKFVENTARSIKTR